MTARRQGPSWPGVVTVVLAVALIAGQWAWSGQIAPATQMTGWLLTAFVVFLASYNLRKKLTMIPIGSAAAWLRLHIAASVLAVVLFALHIGTWRPTGVLECLLAVVFAATVGSGIVGLVLSRLLPARMLALGENMMLERLPLARRRLRDAARAIAMESATDRDSTVVADVYLDRFAAFFAGPRHFWEHLLGSQRPRQTLLEEIDAAKRYQAPAERGDLDRLAELVQRKDDLDARHAGLITLRSWLFVHIPLTWALLILMAAHVVLVHLFAGGLW